MREIELKFLEIDKRGLVPRLRKLGAQRTFSGRMHALMFDYPDLRLRKAGILIRLRSCGSCVHLTMKRKLSLKAAKGAEETEFAVPDVATARTLLEGIGLVVTGEARKNRESYALGKASYDFDTQKGIPTYLEIEAGTMRDLKIAVKKIGLRWKDGRPWNIRQVEEHYQRLS
jgi:predicted adenylyl cyclase CyaB